MHSTGAPPPGTNPGVPVVGGSLPGGSANAVSNPWLVIEAQSELIENLQRMLQSTCPPGSQEGEASGGAGAVAGGGPAAPPRTCPPGGDAGVAAFARPTQPLPADEGAGSYAPRAIAAEDRAAGIGSVATGPKALGGPLGVVAEAPFSATGPTVASAVSSAVPAWCGGGGYPGAAGAQGYMSGSGGSPPKGPPPAFGATGPAAMGSPAGVVTGSALQASASPCVAGTPGGSVSCGAGTPSAPTPVGTAASVASASSSVPVSVNIATNGNSETRYEDVANEVLRLRLQKSQHEELRAQLTRAEGQLRRLSPHTIFQLRSYLERHFKEPHMAAQVQEAMVRLLASLCAVNHIEVGAWTPMNLLNSTRRLFRDPHSFTGRLCSLPHVSGEEAKGLANFILTTSSQFKRVREKEVNECFEAFNTWLSAFYFYSVVADQVGPSIRALEQMEATLRRLSGQGDSGEPSWVASGASSTPSAVAHLAAPAPSRTSSIASVPATPVRSATAASGVRGARTPAAGRGLASPLTRGRVSTAGVTGTAPPRSSPMPGRTRVSTEADQSCSPPPGPRASGGILRQRPSPTSPHAPSSSSRAGMLRSVQGPSSASGPTRSQTAFSSSNRRGDAAAETVVVQTLAGSGRTPSGSPSLSRTQSEKGLGVSVGVNNRSPRVSEREKRLPSPATIRTTSPQANPLIRVATRPLDRQLPPGSNTGARKAMSPSPSDNALPRAQRMVSAPTTYASGSASRSVNVRTKESASAAAQNSRTGSGAFGNNSVGSASSTGGRLSVSGAGRPGAPLRSAARVTSPDKGAGRMSDQSPTRATADRHHVDDAGSGSDREDHSGDLGDGQWRRRLSSAQYEALVRCAEQVVAVSMTPPPAAPAVVVRTSGQ
eukprot:TRINITY_DN4358_c0_g1_i1.p1 TRINITY_DN4358_c0_g1~~TRINITY_DN4358_c0_g1_i1.p1  ORF type:complete len:919 (+),score=115.86 TRINITY_DN4358_c0_g1_i1:111-2759(+)